MKIICENARIDMFSGLERGVPMKKPILSCKFDCPLCNGQGYTEEPVVRVSEVREWVENNAGRVYVDNCGEMWVVDPYQLLAKLDSMKGETK